jgi:hypothetical protein
LNTRRWVRWFSAVSIILVLWGLVFAAFGLRVLPVERNVLLPWESAIYGAIMIGWGTTLFLVGRIALRRHDAELTKAILIGIVIWLFVEAVYSARFGVWFNVGVDIAVLALFSAPLVATLRADRAQPRSGGNRER